ncbi:MAG: TQO small subunit DoxD [Chloroflexota bacterium]|nr:TQO small subunit DoxD [Chloroflexota bacterium]
MASTDMTASSVTPYAARSRVEKILLLVVRLGLAYLFFTQLWWKVPPTFGCPADYAFTTGTVDAGRIRLERTTGLCDWLGIQKFYAENRPLRALEANLDNTGTPELFLDLSALRQLNGWVVTNVIMPNIAVMGWLIWLAELSIVLLVGLGMFSRLGGLIALGVSAQLYVGLGGIPSPYEWEWVYLNMVLLSVVVIATAPGRFYGLDALLIPRLKRMNNPIARLLLIFTGV